MKKPASVRLKDALKRCRRGDTFARCETECYYGKKYKHDCQKHMIDDALRLLDVQEAEITRLSGNIEDTKGDDD